MREKESKKGREKGGIESREWKGAVRERERNPYQAQYASPAAHSSKRLDSAQQVQMIAVFHPVPGANVGNEGWQKP